MKKNLVDNEADLNMKEDKLKAFNPMRQLKLGYSIVSSGGKVVKSVSDVNIGDNMFVKVYNGEIETEIKKIKHG